MIVVVHVEKFEILQDFTDYQDYMGLSLMV
jgi:hypothetical protein